MQVHTLFEGTYSVDATKKFVPFDPAIHHFKDRPASLFINVQPFLVELKNDLILFDTEKETTFTKEFMKSKSQNTPFLDKTLKGSVDLVVLGNEILLER